jgi:tetratricopeptide (TPR) repeat protein
MAAFDREAALKTAEKALRQGRIDAAITEYVRIVEKQPRDWNSANALGDLFIRANQISKGIAQYTRIADHLAEEGFYSKAGAVYKKILKIKPDDEHSLMQSADMAAKQGRLADAKTFYKMVADRRRSRGDKKGAAEVSIRIGTLDPDDLEARLGAARAAADMGETATALREFTDIAAKHENQGQRNEALAAFRLAYDLDPKDADIRGKLVAGYLATGDLAAATKIATGTVELKQIAAVLEREGRHEEVLQVLAKIVELDPADVEVRAGLAQAYAAKGDLTRARTFVSRETAGTNPALWLMVAEMALSSGKIAEGRAAIEETLKLDPSQREAIVALGCRLAERTPEAGYPCIDAVADAALAQNDYGAAAAALHEFVTRVRYHVIALMRLVDVCVDGGLEATMYEAQAQLADAYLEVGRGLEARIISEDLVAREPWNRANIERFRRALVMLGETDPDGIIAERLSGESPFLATDKLDLNEGAGFDEPDSAAAKPKAAARVAAPPVASPPVASPSSAKRKALKTAAEQVIDFDMSDTKAPAAGRGQKRSNDDVFADKHDDAGRDSDEEAAAEQYQLALTYRDLGMVEEAIKALGAATRSPRQRFDACSLLARLYVERNDMAAAVQWFERGAEAPAPTVDASRALFYEFAETLEKVGEHERALGVFAELESESGGYRDVADRIERLSQPRAKR